MKLLRYGESRNCSDPILVTLKNLLYLSAIKDYKNEWGESSHYRVNTSYYNIIASRY